MGREIGERGLDSAGIQVDLSFLVHASSVLSTWTDYGNISTPRGFAKLSSVYFRVDELQKEQKPLERSRLSFCSIFFDLLWRAFLFPN